MYGRVARACSSRIGKDRAVSRTADAATREIIDHYRTYDESQRLKGDIGPLALTRTRELMERHLPPTPAVVLDVGGATGVYAFWLAERGYRVHLVDVRWNVQPFQRAAVRRRRWKDTAQHRILGLVKGIP